MRILTIGVVLSLAACSGSDESEPCDLAHRDGTYLFEYRERGGDCGALQDSLLRLDADAPPNPACALDADDDVSSDQCTLSRSLTCALMDPDGSIQGVMITHEKDGGARFEGLYTITIRNETGAYVCSGTYDVRATRQ